jgi:outer membrane lipoprotein LolB
MKRLLCMCLLALLCACASQESVFRARAPGSVQPQDQSFNASGRLSVQVDGKGQVANFEWSHTAARDELSVNTPIGTTVARLTRDSHGVKLEADGKAWEAPDVETLTQARLGWSLPLGNLAWWLRGQAAPGVPLTLGEDGSLQQQGWHIRFTTAPDNPGPYPRRVDLERDNLNIRLVTYHWQ